MTAPITSLQTLKSSGRAIAVPFTLFLTGDNTLQCSQILRLLPGKRLVLRADYEQQPVLAKLFFDTANWQKEIQRYQILRDTGIRTPKLLAHYAVEEGGVCLYSFIDDATALDAAWQQGSDEQKRLWLDQLQHCLQTLWQRHLLQEDLHLGNFLLRTDAEGDAELWMLDPASVRPYARPQEPQHNLALLLAQLPRRDWPLLLQHWAVPSEVVTLAEQKWQERKHHYLQKIFRDCTEIADLSPNKQLRILCRRQQLDDTLANWLSQPTRFAQNATLLKNGNSAKVFLVMVGSKPYVVKQYLNKDWLRKLRRAWRPSRAARSWYFAHAFLFADIAVPAPVALVEQKTGPFVTSAWFISEYCGDENLLAHWQHTAPSVQELNSLRELFTQLAQLCTSHGDMKATNLLSNGQRIAVIDYDGASEWRQPAALQQALRKDKQRLLANWADNAHLQQQLTAVIPA
ncbi:MAG: hypothetical protein IT470_00420 [Pseudomonadales bacterium]|nr:hypothetical protein [Pseudomonadales bacterium]